MTDYNLIEEYFLKVDQLFMEGDFPEGKEVLEEILSIEPDYGRAHNHLGWLYYAKFDDYIRAEYHLKLAIKYSPEYPNAWVNYVYLLNEINDTEKLLKVIPKALKVEGINKSTMFNELGRSCEINGFYDEAIKDYKLALKHCMSNNDIEIIESNINRAKKKKAFMNNTAKKRYLLF